LAEMTRHAMEQAMETSVTTGTKLNERKQRTKLQVLQRMIRKGLREVERGKVVSAESAFAAVDKMLRRGRVSKRPA
jgi:predicted transcriptional regulator